MALDNATKEKAVSILNQIMETELAGVVRYTHYGLMLFGYHRIPIGNWMKSQAKEALQHAERAGEMLTLLGGHPSLKIGNLLETEKHDIKDILEESLQHEKESLCFYYQLMELAQQSKSVLLEEYARSLIVEEELHVDQVNKMLRSPGDIEAFSVNDCS